MTSQSLLIMIILIPNVIKAATFGNFLVNSSDGNVESDHDHDAEKDRTVNGYKEVFYSKFLSTIPGDDKPNNQEEPINVIIDSSSSSYDKDETSSKYIKISSSIEIPETESVTLILEALKVLWNAMMTSIMKGFMPNMERMRRDTTATESSKGTFSYWLLCHSIFIF